MSHLVLVVEDHPFMRRAVRDVLIEHGLTVMTADGVTSANRLMMARGAQFSILVTDVNLQDGNGWQVARTARRTWPQMHVLYMSAEPQCEFDDEAVPHSALIPKPFDGTELSRALSCLGLYSQAAEPA